MFAWENINKLLIKDIENDGKGKKIPPGKLSILKTTFLYRA